VIDLLVATIEAAGMIAGGEQNALHTVAARALEQVVAADDVGAQDRLPRAFDREAAEMNDGVDPRGDAHHVAEPTDVTGREALVRQKLFDWPDIGQAHVVLARELGAQHRADAAGGSGQKNSLHVWS
jgi:hypothetical protein